MDIHNLLFPKIFHLGGQLTSTLASLPIPLPIITEKNGRTTYRNDTAGYQFSLPTEASLNFIDLRQITPNAHPEALSENIMSEEYLEQLAQTYGDYLCMDIYYRTGVIRIAARRDPGVDWACPGTGSADGLQITPKTELVGISNQPFQAEGWKANNNDGNWLAIKASNRLLLHAGPGIWLANVKDGQLYQFLPQQIVNGFETEIEYPDQLIWPLP